MMLTLDPPSNITSLMVFLPTCTCITTMGLSMVTTTIIVSNVAPLNPILVLSKIGFDTFVFLINFIFSHRYQFKSKAISNNCPKFRVHLVSNICMFMSWNISSMVFTSALLSLCVFDVIGISIYTSTLGNPTQAMF